MHGKLGHENLLPQENYGPTSGILRTRNQMGKSASAKLFSYCILGIKMATEEKKVREVSKWEPG